jgi:hypothetical protein
MGPFDIGQLQLSGGPGFDLQPKLQPFGAINGMPDLRILLDMAQRGIQPRDLKDYQGEMPYTGAGVYPSNRGHVYSMDKMSSDLGGVTFRNDSGRDSAVILNSHDTDPATLGHELEHVLANQGLGAGAAVNTKFGELNGDDTALKRMATRNDIVKRLVEAAPHLIKEWGLDPQDAKGGYFSPKMYEYQGQHAPNLMNEQFATLSALEQRKNKRLVDDPYIRQNVLRTPSERESYDAVTGLRQTRLDARDLPPYTRLPEVKQRPMEAKQKVATKPQPTGLLDRLMHALKPFQ